MKFFTVLVLFLNLSFAAFANDIGLLGGIRSSSADTDIRGASVSSNPDYQFGLLAHLDLMRAWKLRTGLILTQRQVTIKPTAAGTVDINFTYVDVPATGLYRFSNYAGVFAGPVLSFNQSKDVSCTNKPNCGAQGVDSIIIPWQVGVSFRFMYQMGAELYYEYLPGNIEQDVSNMKTVGANFVFYFD